MVIIGLYYDVSERHSTLNQLAWLSLHIRWRERFRGEGRESRFPVGPVNRSGIFGVNVSRRQSRRQSDSASELMRKTHKIGRHSEGSHHMAPGVWTIHLPPR
jgi:hypothetical protein